MWPPMGSQRRGRRGKASQDQPKEDADPDSTEKGLSAAVSQLELSGTPLSTDEQTLCVVCMDAPKTHAIVPCGHVCICEGCAEKLLAPQAPLVCPMCREHATMVMKLYN